MRINIEALYDSDSRSINIYYNGEVDGDVYLYLKREFGIRNAIKKLNRQLEKVAYSFGNFADI